MTCFQVCFLLRQGCINVLLSNMCALKTVNLLLIFFLGTGAMVVGEPCVWGLCTEDIALVAAGF